MLSAKVEEDQVSSDSPTKGRIPVDGVGNVVSSIEGLQHRLSNFTHEEIAKAEGQIQALLSSISEIADRLQLVARIHHGLTRARISLADMETKGLYVTSFEAVQPMLEEIAQCTPIIQFRSQDSESLNGPSSKNANAEVIESAKSELINLELENNSGVVSRTGDDNFSPKNVSKISRALTLLRSPTLLSENIESGDSDGGPQTTSSKPEASGESDAETNAKPQFENLSKENPVASHEYAPDSQNSSHEVQFDTHAATDFDQQLLDDLIKNYGEFATFSEPHASLKPLPNGTVDFEFNGDKAPPLIPPTSSTPSTDFGNSAPVPVRKEGELDVRLKKLIKDYGEYDLYSRESPLKLKTGVIGALILLAAILAAFYFLSSPKPTLPESNANVPPVTSRNGITEGAAADSEHVMDVSQTKANAKVSHKNKK